MSSRAHIYWQKLVNNVEKFQPIFFIYNTNFSFVTVLNFTKFNQRVVYPKQLTNKILVSAKIIVKIIVYLSRYLCITCYT